MLQIVDRAVGHRTTGAPLKLLTVCSAAKPPADFTGFVKARRDQANADAASFLTWTAEYLQGLLHCL